MIKLLLIGAGSRGYEAYGRLIKMRNDAKIIAVAEPDEDKRKRLAREHNIPDTMQFSSWEKLLEKEKFADGIIIATPDRLHVEPAISAMKKGYHVLLEKPIAPTKEGVQKVVSVAKQTNRIVVVGHVLRYTKFFKKLKELLDSKVIGDIVGIEHKENVGFFHFAHSFVRGNWRNSRESSPSILAKSCHDLDILYWLTGARCKTLTSFGELMYFRPENKPDKAALRCLDCPDEIERLCPYSAKKIYLTDYIGWPVSVISLDLSYEGRMKALREGPYGRCVFACDNDVVDHQIVNMVFENGVKATFTMTAFSDTITRRIRIFGTQGEIRGEFEKGEIEVIKFGWTERKFYNFGVYDMGMGHGGGDKGIVRHFISLLKGDESRSFTNIEESAHSHFMAFAAEESRLEGGIPINL